MKFEGGSIGLNSKLRRKRSINSVKTQEWGKCVKTLQVEMK